MITESFVGRRPELSELRTAIDSTASGRGSLVLLAGEPGIGKTTLAEAAAAHARDAGLHVRWASCWDGPAPAFWPWVQLLRAHIDGGAEPPAEVGRLVGEAAAGSTDVLGGDAETARFALFDTVASYLRAEATRAPLLLVLDDLHWADVPSLRLLEFVARDLRSTSIVVLGTYRDVEVDTATDTGATLARISAGAPVVKLEGLPATDVAELLRTTTGALAATEFTRTVHEKTGGNPLFVRELARLLAASGERETARVPEGIIGVIQRRLARLSQASHTLLTLAAVLGNQFRIDMGAAAAGVDVNVALALVEEAVSARLVAADPTRVGCYVFSHALVRDALYEAIPLSRRGDVHLAAARAIESVGAVDERLPELAHHYLQTLPAGDVVRAVELCERAGRRARGQLAYEDAVAHFQRALDALTVAPDEDRQAGLMLELGDAQLRAGDMPAARATFEDVANLARRRRRPDELAQAALGLGAGLEGFEIRMADQPQIDLLEQASQALGSEDSGLRARVLARLSVAVAYQQSMDERREMAEEAVAMSRRAGDRAALAYALAAHCDAIAGPDDCELRLAEANEIVSISRGDGNRAMELLGRRLLVLAHLEVGDLASATAEMDAFARTAELIQQSLYSWYPALWKGMRAALDGRVDDAMAAAEEAEAIGARAHSENAPMLATVLRMVVAYYWERYDDLKRIVDELAKLTDYVPVYMDYYMGTLHSLRGEIEIARPHVARFAGGGIRNLPVDAEWLPGSCMFAEALFLVGDVTAASEHYERLLPHRHRFAVEGIGAGLYGSVEHYLALLAWTIGRLAEAEAHFEAALSANAPLGAPLLVARTQRELARLCRDLGETDRARDLDARANAARAAFGVGLARDAEPARASEAVFRRDGEIWTLAFDGATTNMRDAKGLHDIAKLLARPGREVAALDLATDVAGSVRRSGEELHAPGSAGEVIDSEARAQYKGRLEELEEEIADAEAMGDAVRTERARAERDAIAHELASAYGLGGRPRKAGDPAERARTAVTRRIRDAVARVEDAHPALGRHLRNAVKTGTFCVYEPERPVDWSL